MPPASKKNCSVILFDLATKSKEKAIQTLLKICCNNFFAGSKDLTKLILVNSDETENHLAARHDGYEHINEVAKDIMEYNPRVMLEMVENSGRGEANWLEAILVGLYNLVDEYQDIGGIITYQLLFITDLTSPLANYDKKVVNKIVNEINKIEAYFYVIGPDVEVPFTLKTSSDVKRWMNNLNVDKNNQNLQIIKEIVTNTKNSVVCDFKVGIHLFFSYRNWGGSQPWQVPLGIGTKVKIPAQTLRILNEGMQCKLKSLQSRFGQTVWIDAEDESVEIDPADVKNGIMRHEKFVLMPDNKMFQVENPRSFSVLCFTNSTNVPEYIMRGDGYCVLPNGTSENNEAMTVLIDCLAQQGKYVIARRVYNNNFVPKIVVLIPKPDHNPKSFLLASLPFAEDVRFNYREKSLEAAPKIETDENIYKFLDSVNVENDNCEKQVALGIPMMLDSNCQKLINKATDKFLEKYMNLEEVDVDYLAGDVNGKAVEDLKSIWQERSLTEAKKKEETVGDDSDNEFDW